MRGSPRTPNASASSAHVRSHGSPANRRLDRRDPETLAQWVHPADSADSGGYEVEVLLGGLIRRSGAPLKLLQPPATVAELGAGLNDGQPLAEAA